MSAVDATASLAHLQSEAGSDVVEAHLEQGAAMSSTDWSEVVQRRRGWSNPRVGTALYSPVCPSTCSRSRSA